MNFFFMSIGLFADDKERITSQLDSLNFRSNQMKKKRSENNRASAKFGLLLAPCQTKTLEFDRLFITQLLITNQI